MSDWSRNYSKRSLWSIPILKLVLKFLKLNFVRGHSKLYWSPWNGCLSLCCHGCMNSAKQNYHKGIRAFGEVTAWDFVKATWHMETAYGNLLTLKGKEKSGSEWWTTWKCLKSWITVICRIPDGAHWDWDEVESFPKLSITWTIAKG